MQSFKINNRFKITIVFLALVVVLSIGGGVVIASIFIGNSGSGTINLQKGLVGHWKLDGDAKDATPYSHSLTNNNSVVFTAADRKGQASKAAQFAKASTQYLSHAGDADLRGSTSGWSASAWVYLDSGSTSQIIMISEGSSKGYSFFYSNLGNFQVRGDNGTTGVTVATSSVTTGTWYFVYAYYDGVNIGISLNNGTPVTGVLTYVPGVGTTFNVGAAGDATFPFDGRIDDARFYNRALSTAEITALYQSYDPGIAVSTLQKGLIGYWDLNNTAEDKTPNSNNGTVTGSTPTTDRNSQSNKAYSFDGAVDANDYIEVPANATISNVFDGGGTIAFWAYVRTIGEGVSVDRGRLIDRAYASLLLYTYSITSGTVRIGDKYIFSGTDREGYFNIPQNTWTHIVYNYNADSTSNIPSVYINGSSVDAYTATVTPTGTRASDAGAPLVFGNDSSAAARTLDGSMDDIRIYRRTLSTTEITALYNSYDPGIAVSTLQKGLIGYWDLNNTAEDKTPNSNNGTVTGSTPTTDRNSQSNKAYLFDGTNDVIDMGANYVVANGDTRSFAFWVNPLDNGLYDFILGKSQGCGNYGQYTIRSTSNGVMFNYVNDALTITDYTGPAAALSTWSHYVITYTFGTGSTMKMYKNGALASGSWDADAGNLTVTNTYIGNLNFGRFGDCTGEDYFFKGSIDDVRIYNRALSATEVLALYNSY